MKVTLNNIGKRYNTEWILRGINFEFSQGNAYAILGANGSGKSTLLQIIAGNISPTEGCLTLTSASEKIEESLFFSYLSFASPYLELPEEMTLFELIKFHFRFKKPVREFTAMQIIETLELENSKDKQLKYFSSGMRQRVRLGLAILSDVPILLLDEPTGNLDKSGTEWYRKIIAEYSNKKLIIVCSNHQEKEYDFCVEKINL